MSRIGKNPVPIVSGVDVKVAGQDVTVKGPKGTLERTFHERITIVVDESEVRVERNDEDRKTRALHGLSRALLANMVEGVSAGFSKELSIVGVGYRASLKGKDIELLVGYSHPVEILAPDGITFELPDQTRIIVSGIDKELVGQVAADIRKVRPPEPYKGKGIRYVDEYVRRKAGKAGVAR